MAHQYDLTAQELATEIWKPVHNWETRYEVSSLGRVRRLWVCYECGHPREPLTMKPKIGKNGYTAVTLQHKRGGVDKMEWPNVHTLVAEAFLGLRPGANYEVNHIDGCKHNNRLQNLEWLTISGNCLHAKKSGLVPYVSGIAEMTRKITPDDVRAIRASAESSKVLGARYGITSLHVTGIRSRRSWRHIE